MKWNEMDLLKNKSLIFPLLDFILSGRNRNYEWGNTLIDGDSGKTDNAFNWLLFLQIFKTNYNWNLT